MWGRDNGPAVRTLWPVCTVSPVRVKIDNMERTPRARGPPVPVLVESAAKTDDHQVGEPHKAPQHPGGAFVVFGFCHLDGDAEHRTRTGPHPHDCRFPAPGRLGRIDLRSRFGRAGHVLPSSPGDSRAPCVLGLPAGEADQIDFRGREVPHNQIDWTVWPIDGGGRTPRHLSGFVHPLGEHPGPRHSVNFRDVKSVMRGLGTPVSDEMRVRCVTRPTGQAPLETVWPRHRGCFTPRSAIVRSQQLLRPDPRGPRSWPPCAPDLRGRATATPGWTVAPAGC